MPDARSPLRWSADAIALLEAAPDAIIISSPEQGIVQVNAQADRMFCYLRGELIGQPIDVLVPERYRARHPGHRNDYAGQPRPRPMGAPHIELFGLRKDGSEFPAEISLSPMQTEAGLLIISAVRDATERKLAERQRARLLEAQESIRARDEFLSIAWHELKTPLTPLQLQAQSLIRLARSGAAPPTREQLLAKGQTMDRMVQRMSTLIAELLDVSRITAGRLHLELEEVELGALVDEVVARFADEAERVGSTVLIERPGPVLGRWDAMRLEQVITNLVSNAIKYGQGKPITVKLSGDGPARLSVRDGGIGILGEDQARIFHRFERAVATRAYGGFGLGLWIVRQIVEAHGGVVRVESSPGAGSTFTVELPRA